MEHTPHHPTHTPTVRRRRWRGIAGAVVGTALATGTGVGTSHAAPVEGPPQRAPVECAGVLLGETPAQVSAAVEAEAARTGRAAIDVLVDRLDQHEAELLTAAGVYSGTIGWAAGLIASYNDVRGVVLAERRGEA